MTPEAAERLLPGFGAQPIQTREELYDAVKYLMHARLNKGLDRNATVQAVPVQNLDQCTGADKQIAEFIQRQL